MISMKKLLFILTIFCTYQYSIAQSKRTIDNDKLLELYQSQRYMEAADYLRGIYSEDTQNPKELNQLAYANIMAGKLPEAEKNYLKLYEQQPKNIPVLFSLANINSRRGNDEKAKEYFEEIITIDSTNFNAYKRLADIYKGEDIISIITKMKILEKANKLNNTDADVAFDLCEVYFKMQAAFKAIKVLDTALTADSTNLRLLKMKMPIGLATKNYNVAIETGETLLKYGDSSSFVLNNLAKSYFLQLNYQKALKYFLKLDSQKLGNEVLYYNIGMSYRGLKDYKNAIPYLEKAIDQGISQKIATYYGLLGDSFEGVNKNTEANTSYKRGLLFENNGSLLYNIALVYETKLNDKKNAIDYYGQYLKTINANEQPKLIGFIKNKIEELKRR